MIVVWLNILRRRCEKSALGKIIVCKENKNKIKIRTRTRIRIGRRIIKNNSINQKNLRDQEDNQCLRNLRKFKKIQIKRNK